MSLHLHKWPEFPRDPIHLELRESRQALNGSRAYIQVLEKNIQASNEVLDEWAQKIESLAEELKEIQALQEQRNTIDQQVAQRVKAAWHVSTRSPGTQGTK